MSTSTQSNSEIHKGDSPVVQSLRILKSTLQTQSLMTLLAKNVKPLVNDSYAGTAQVYSDKKAPVIILNDLSTQAGSTVSMTLHHDITGKPIMGTANAEGKGTLRTRSKFKLSIDRYTKSVKDGDIYAIQERGYELKRFNKSDLGLYFMRLMDQLLLVHLAGARGHKAAHNLPVPLEGDDEFQSIIVNELSPPSAYNGGDGLTSRHFFAADKDSISGGNKPLTNLDTLSLRDISILKARLEEMASPPSFIDLSPEDDPYKYDPMYVLLVGSRGWTDLMDSDDGKLFNQYRSQATERGKIIAGGQDKVHPLFRDDCMLVGNILVKKMPAPIRFLPAMPLVMHDPTRKHRTLVDQMVPDQDKYCVERALLIGGEALGLAFGNTMAGAKPMDGEDMSARNFRYLEAKYDFGRKSETGIDWVMGAAKIGFNNEDGIYVDRGVIALDYATHLIGGKY